MGWGAGALGPRAQGAAVVWRAGYPLASGSSLHGYTLMSMRRWQGDCGHRGQQQLLLTQAEGRQGLALAPVPPPCIHGHLGEGEGLTWAGPPGAQTPSQVTDSSTKSMAL